MWLTKFWQSNKFVYLLLVGSWGNLQSRDTSWALVFLLFKLPCDRFLFRNLQLFWRLGLRLSTSEILFVFTHLLDLRSRRSEWLLVIILTIVIQAVIVCLWLVASFSVWKKFPLLLLRHYLHVFAVKRADTVSAKRHSIAMRKLFYLGFECWLFLLTSAVLHPHRYAIQMFQVSLIVRGRKRFLPINFFLLKIWDLLLLEHKVLHWHHLRW